MGQLNRGGRSWLAFFFGGEDLRIIVIGCGRVGSRLAVGLSAEGHDVVVIDRSREALAALGPEFDGETVLGTGIDEDVLRRAGIEVADACAAVTADDNTNIMAAQVAKVVFAVPKVVARIYDPDRERIYHQLGLDTVSTVKLGATSIRSLITTDELQHIGVLGSGEVRIVQSVVRRGLAGKTVEEAELPGTFRVIALIRNGSARLLHARSILAEGDVLVGAVSDTDISPVKSHLGL